MKNINFQILSLGLPIKEYPRSQKNFFKISAMSLVFAMLAYGIFYGAWSEAKNPLVEKIGLSLLGAFMALPALGGIYMLWTRRGSRVRIYASGLSYRQGAQEFAASWDEISSLTESSASRISTKDGTSFEFGDNIEGYPEVAERLRAETLKRMLPEARASLQRGEFLSFPKLKMGGGTVVGKALDQTLLGGEGFTLSSRGIESEGRSLPWSELKDFGIAPGQDPRKTMPQIYLQGANVSFQMKAGILPNAHLLLALCEEFSGKARGKNATL